MESIKDVQRRLEKSAEKLFKTYSRIPNAYDSINITDSEYFISIKISSMWSKIVFRMGTLCVIRLVRLPNDRGFTVETEFYLRSKKIEFAINNQGLLLEMIKYIDKLEAQMKAEEPISRRKEYLKDVRELNRATEKFKDIQKYITDLKQKIAKHKLIKK